MTLKGTEKTYGKKTFLVQVKSFWSLLIPSISQLQKPVCMCLYVKYSKVSHHSYLY